MWWRKTSSVGQRGEWWENARASMAGGISEWRQAGSLPGESLVPSLAGLRCILRNLFPALTCRTMNWRRYATS